MIRSLGRAGLRVEVLVPERERSSALASRYVARVHRLPAAEAIGGAAWVDAVRALVEAEDLPAVVAVDDTSLIPLHEHRDRLGPTADRFALLGDHTYRVSQNKPEQRRLAESLGIPVAPGVIATDDAAALQFAAGVMPVVVKPASSFASADLATKRRVMIARDRPAVVAALAVAGKPVVVEQFVPGVGVGIGFLAHHGGVKMAFQHRRVHERIGGGDSSYRVGVPLDPALADSVGRLTAATDYTGVGMAEFRVDPVSGDWVFVELNGRFWGSLPLAMASGADFPHHLYRMMFAGATEFPTGYRVGLFGRNEPRDLQWLWHNLTADRADPTLGRVSPTRILGEIGNLLTGRERWDTLVRDDPAPAFREVALQGRKLWVRLVRRPWRSLVARLRRPARRTELLRRLRTDHRVLVVCHGNICRSPFAAARLKAELPEGWQVRQGGTHAVPGRASTPEAIAAAAEAGVDLATHGARALADGDLQDAAVVLAFDWQIRDELAARYPEHTDRLFLIGEVTPGSVEIADPFGEPVDGYRSTYRDIDRRVDLLLAAIR